MTHTRSLALAGLALGPLLALASAGACGDSVRSGGSAGSAGDAATTTATSGGAGSGGAGSGGATATGTGTGGEGITCDDLGFCGEPMDPGCVACAISDGACQDEYEACKRSADNACLDLLDCYRDCSDDDTPCFDACDAKFQSGSLPLSLLLDCVFCGECPVSCNIDISGCP